MATPFETRGTIRTPYIITTREIAERPTIQTPLSEGTYVEFPAQINLLRRSPISIEIKRNAIEVYFPTIVHPQLGVAHIIMHSFREIPPGDSRGRPASPAHGTIRFFYGDKKTNLYVLPGGEHPRIEKTTGILQFIDTNPIGEAHFDKERELSVLTLSEYSIPFALAVRPQTSCLVYLPALSMVHPIIIRDFTPQYAQRNTNYPNARIDLPNGNFIMLYAKKPVMECMVNDKILFKGVYLTGLNRSTT